jgi:uncharacterized protein YjaZ
VANRHSCRKQAYVIRTTVACVAGVLMPTARLGAQAENQLTIVPVYETIGRFADTARSVSDAAERARLYQRLVIDQHPECASRRPRYDWMGAADDLGELRARVVALSAARAPALVEEGIRRARAALRGPAVVVCLGLTRPSPATRLLRGVSGFAGDGVVHLFVDPTQEGWASVLPFTVAHEYHHVTVFARRLQPGPRTILWRLVLEGKADVFASRLYPRISRPWHEPFEAADERQCSSQLKERLRQPANTPEFLNDYMIAWTGRAPRFCGYAMGRRLVLSYLERRPDLSPEEWSAASPDEVLAAARWNGDSSR